VTHANGDVTHANGDVTERTLNRMVAGLGGTARAVERVLARTEGGLVDSEHGSEDELSPMHGDSDDEHQPHHHWGLLGAES
jgi:hypothetical protein